MGSLYALRKSDKFIQCSLGDRHGENILLDVNSGDVVHVDFNCLFEKVRSRIWVQTKNQLIRDLGKEPRYT